jgi:hypothetical protein
MGQGRIWEEYVSGPLDSGEAQEKVYQAMRETVTPLAKPDPRKHLEATMQHIVSQALASYKATGRVRWPQSVERALGEIARSTNDPSLLSDQGGVEQVIKQGRAFARYITETGPKR